MMKTIGSNFLSKKLSKPKNSSNVRQRCETVIEKVKDKDMLRLDSLADKKGQIHKGLTVKNSELMYKTLQNSPKPTDTQRSYVVFRSNNSRSEIPPQYVPRVGT